MAIYNTRSRLVLISAVTLFLASCQSEENASEVSTVSSLPGVKLYEQNCVSCHGKTGDLGVSDAADLTTSEKSLEDKIEFIKSGSANGIMMPYAKSNGGPLSDEEIENIANYIETLKH